jgi:acetyl esterase/lipase
MYAAFTGYLARETGCEVFVADYRLAPEFPFPAGLLDAIAVYEEMLDRGVSPDRLFVAGDSGGGGLATSLLLDSAAHHLPRPAGVLLFSPEVDLALDEPSVTENASSDILPWNIPVGPYLHGIDPHNKFVSAVYADLHRYPPTFVAFGDEEMFRDPIRRFVDRLDEAEVPTTVIEERDMFHVFPMLMPWAEASRRVYREVGRFVHDQLALLEPDVDSSEAGVT